VTTLITGVTGFIGSHLANSLVEESNEKVVAVVRDYRPERWFNDVLSKCYVVKTDILDFRNILRAIVDYEVDTVIHLAAVAIVKTASRDPIDTFQTNVMGTVSVLESCRLSRTVNKILVNITDKIYGNQMDADVDSRCYITEAYSGSKVAQDICALTYANTYGMKILRTRCCNVFGMDFNNRIIPNTIRNCLLGISPVIYTNENTLRQYIYIQDLISAFRKLLSDDREGAWNISTNTILSQSKVVEEILMYPDFRGIKPTYVNREKKENHPSTYKEIEAMSIKCSDFGWTPKYNFREGISETVSLFRKWWLGERREGK
jgi:CDP-glucose 4,6-dehydratase